MCAWILLIGEFSLTTHSIFWQRNNDYTNNEIFLTTEEMDKSRMYMKDFQDTANFIFGLNVYDPGFDVLNNPYVLIRGFNAETRADELTGF